ncbi:putative siderophore biosynthesis enzyme [Penicillium digitatum]|uniref:Putative siderophore biosynthesis enzyme n=1 Tax=Penicillium digitatum TaxID=36651 RepID=A0A7T6XS40_PENDI|nr:putative siderophore biosynthesis enzyme [Penicillium digitatum]
MKPVTLCFLLGLASLATARTDLEGCVSSEVIFDHYYASYLWYVPDSGCPQYSGTATLTPDYLEGWGPNGKQAASTSTIALTALSTAEIVSAFATQTSEVMITDAPSGLTVVTSSLKISTSSTSNRGNAASPSAAAASSSTLNAATTPSSNIAGIMAVIAAMVGVMVL